MLRVEARQFELVAGSHDKFYRLFHVRGAGGYDLITQYGRRGTFGQFTRKSDRGNLYDELEYQKRRKGYYPVSGELRFDLGSKQAAALYNSGGVADSLKQALSDGFDFAWGDEHRAVRNAVISGTGERVVAMTGWCENAKVWGWLGDIVQDLKGRLHLIKGGLMVAVVPSQAVGGLAQLCGIKLVDLGPVQPGDGLSTLEVMVGIWTPKVLGSELSNGDEALETARLLVGASPMVRGGHGS